MDITPQMQAIINGLPGGSQPQPEGGGLGRVGKNILNLPGNIVEGIVGGVSGLAQLGIPEEMRAKVDFPNFFDVPPAQTTGDMVGDFLIGKGGVADVMGQILLPAGLVGRAGKALGMAEGKLLDATRFAAGETIAEAGRPDSTPTDVAVAGAVGGLQAPLAYLPPRLRVPLSALLAGGHGLYENAQRGPISGGVTATADFLAGLIGLPGRATAPLDGPIGRELALRPDMSPVPVEPEVINLGRGQRVRYEGRFETEGTPYYNPDVIYARGHEALPAPRMELPAPRGPISGFRVADELYQSGQLPPPPAFVGPVAPRRVFPREPEIATLQNAPAAAPPRVNPEPTVPVVRPQAAPVELKPEQRFKWDRQEQAYATDLSARYNKLDDNELQEVILDLDNEIANSLDDQTVRSYSLSREVAQTVLDSRRAPTKSEAKTKAPKLEKIKRNQRVSYQDELGELQHGTVVGFTKNEARIVFDGRSGEATVPRARLTTANVPAKGIATLQKPDFDDVQSAEIGQNLEQLDEGMRRVDVSEIERQQERVPGMRERVEPEDLHGAKYAVDETARGKGADDYILPRVAAKLQDIIQNIIRATNKNVRINFVDDLIGGQLAINSTFGQIEVNQKKISQWFKDWPTMSATQRATTLVRFSQLLGHEIGHSALLWLRANDLKKYKALIEEFKNLSKEGREKLMEKFHLITGRNPRSSSIPYFAGSPEGIMEGYKWIHPRAQEALDDFGMEEFFAEMFSAHSLGLLDEAKLPTEMRGFWQRIKDVFRKLVSLFTPSTYDDIGDLEELASLQVFNDMVEEIAEGFRKADTPEYNQAMRAGSAVRDAQATTFVRQSQKLEAQDKAADIARDKALQTKAKTQQLVEDPNWMPEGGPITYAAKGAFGGTTLKHAFAKELTQELGAGLAGAVLGGVAGPEITDGQVSMAEGILMGGIMGALGPRAIKALLAVPKSTGATFHHRTFAESLRDIFKGNAEGVAADAATGHGSSVAKFMRFLERNFNFHLPKELFNAVVEADGAAAWALHTVDDAFKKAKNFKESPALTAATETYLKGGNLADYKKAATGLGKEAEQIANFYIAGREAIATLQKHFAAGLPNGKFKSMILESLSKGDYLTRQYRIFHDPKYRPTQVQVEAAAQKYVSDKKGVVTLDAARSIIEDYIHEIKTAGADFRGSVTDVGKKLDSYLWERREMLDPTFRDMLGEYHDPREKVLGTIQHLYTSSITGKLIDTVSGLKDVNGLDFSYSVEQHSAMIDAISNAIKKGTPPAGKSLATLQKELNTLRAYVPLDANNKYGKLAGKMVSRFVRDQLATFDSPWGLLDGTIMRTMAKFHNAVKIARAPLNPITVVRNIFSMPILAAIGGANPLTDIPRAFKTLRANGPEVREMLEQGILNVDAIRGEMLRDVDYVRMLDVDNSITGLVKKGVNKALDFYRWPDMLVRAATYISAKNKFAKDLGLAPNHADVIAKARDWTNRYTVNYANVAPIVKTLRQVPFTNLFISYTAEITRIAKNLAQDAFKHSDPGQRIRAASLLGGLAATPFALEKFATLQLSEKDRNEWDKARSLMPDYQRTKHLIVLGKESDGRFRYIDMTPLIQIDAFTQMGRALATGDLDAAAAVNPIVSWENTPAINIVSEQITGEDLRSGRPINKNLLTRAKAVLDDVVPPILPGGYEFRRWSEALTPTETGDLGVTNARTGRRTTPGEIVGSYLTGMRIGTVDSNKLHQFAVADAKRKLANESAYLRDVVQTNTTQRAKAKALQRYQEAQRDILLELTQKLQPQ